MIEALLSGGASTPYYVIAMHQGVPGLDDGAYIYDLESGAEVFNIKPYNGITHLAVPLSGRYIAAGIKTSLSAYRIYIYDEQNAWGQVTYFSSESNEIDMIAFSQSGDYFYRMIEASGTYALRRDHVVDGTIDGGEVIGHTSEPYRIIAQHPPEKWAAFEIYDGSDYLVKIYNDETLVHTEVEPNPSQGMMFSSDGTSLLSVRGSGVNVIDLSDFSSAVIATSIAVGNISTFDQEHVFLYNDTTGAGLILNYSTGAEYPLNGLPAHSLKAFSDDGRYVGIANQEVSSYQGSAITVLDSDKAGLDVFEPTIYLDLWADGGANVANVSFMKKGV